MALTLHGLTWPAKRGHVAHAHVSSNQINNTISLAGKKRQKNCLAIMTPPKKPLQ